MCELFPQNSFVQPVSFAAQDFLGEPVSFSIRVIVEVTEEMGDAQAGGIAKVIDEFQGFG